MSEPMWLNSAENDAWLELLTVMEAIPAAVDAQLRRDHGLTRFEYYVLAMLSSHDDGTCPMTDLSVMTNGSLSRLSHAVGKIEKIGWVKRFPMPEDRRTTLVSLTSKGREVLERAAPSHVAEVRRVLFDAIAPDDVAVLAALLRPVAQRALGGDDSCPPDSPASDAS